MGERAVGCVDAGWAGVWGRLGAVRILPLVNFDDAEQAVATARALMRGGIDCVEVTFRTRAAVEAIRALSVLDGLFVAAGTVLSVGQLEQARVAGAQLALAPGSNFEVIRAARACGLPFVAGAGTASEVEALRHFGVRVVKVFPFRTVGGVEFLRSLAAVYPEMRFVPTGGIDAGNLSDAASAPGVLAVGGSWIAPVELVRAGCFDQIEQNARSARMLLW